MFAVKQAIRAWKALLREPKMTRFGKSRFFEALSPHQPHGFYFNQGQPWFKEITFDVYEHAAQNCVEYAEYGE